MNASTRRVLAALCAAGLVFAACSSDDDDGGAATSEATAESSAPDAGTRVPTSDATTEVPSSDATTEAPSTDSTEPGGEFDDVPALAPDYDLGGFEIDAAALQCGNTSPNPTAGVTDSSVKVGGISSLSISYPGVDVGAQVRFDRAAAEGPINGRTVDFVGVTDDASDSNRSIDAASQLVDQEEIFAAVPMISPVGTYIDKFCADVVPFFGYPTNAGFCFNTIAFSIVGCGFTKDNNPTSTAQPQAVRLLLGDAVVNSTAAFVGDDSASGEFALNLVSDYFALDNWDTTYKANVLDGTGAPVDLAPIVQEIMSANDGAGPEIVVQIGNRQNGVRLAGALKAAGYEGSIFTYTTYDAALLGTPELEGTYVISQLSPFEDTSSEAIVQMLADFEEYAPDAPLTQGAMYGYWSAQFFLDALEATGPDLTRDAMLATLNSGDFTWGVPGAVGKTYWPEMHNGGYPCTAIVENTGDAFVPAVRLGCTDVIYTPAG